MSEKRDNSGTLGKNLRKLQDNHPSHSGACLIDGKPYWISAWVKDGPEGSKFFSLAFKPKEDRQPAAEAPPRAPDEFNDEIPF